MAHDKEALTVQRITKQEATRAFVACVGLDPEGQATPESAAAAGECFAVRGPRASVAVSIEFAGGVAWIHAAAGGGDGMAGATLDTLERLAKARHCQRIGFQTMRSGLQRVALRRGYQLSNRIGAGVELEKHL